MTFHVTSSRACVRAGTGGACPLSLTDLSQPSLNERMVQAGANLILLPQHGLCDHDADINNERNKE